MIAAVVTGIGCNDPTGDDLEENFLKKSFSESWQGPRVGWALTTSEVLNTQVAHLSCDDQGRVLYRFEAIVIAAV